MPAPPPADRRGGGLTRGAQVHHFGSKHELMTAAMHHMTARTVATVVADFRRGLTASNDPIGAVLDLLWNTHNAGDSFR